jgi:hypothetical protein
MYGEVRIFVFMVAQSSILISSHKFFVYKLCVEALKKI